MLSDSARGRVVRFLQEVLQDRDTRAYLEEELQRYKETTTTSSPATASNASRRYKIHYAVKHYPGGAAVEQMPPGVGYNSGATDALIAFSILREDGETSFQEWSVDGDTGASLEPEVYLQAWIYFTRCVAETFGDGTIEQLLRRVCGLSTRN
jgi:hypothetical protein